MEAPSEYLTAREAATLLHVSPETIIRWILHRGLPARRVGPPGGRLLRYQVLRAAVEELIRQVPGQRDWRAIARPRAEAVRPQTREALARLGLADCLPG